MLKIFTPLDQSGMMGIPVYLAPLFMDSQNIHDKFVDLLSQKCKSADLAITLFTVKTPEFEKAENSFQEEYFLENMEWSLKKMRLSFRNGLSVFLFPNLKSQNGISESQLLHAMENFYSQHAPVVLYASSGYVFDKYTERYLENLKMEYEKYKIGGGGDQKKFIEINKTLEDTADLVVRLAQKKVHNGVRRDDLIKTV